MAGSRYRARVSRIRSNCQQRLKGLVSAGSNPDVETVKVQTDNYAQVDDHHFEQFNVKASAQQVQAAAGAETAVQTGNAKKLVAHQVAQKTPENATTVKRRKDKNPEKTNVFRGSAGQLLRVRFAQVPEAGVETSEFQQGNRPYSESGGHPGGQFGADCDLQTVIQAWPMLSAGDRATILEVIRRETIQQT